MTKRVLITGMSGTGKSSVIRELKKRGYRAFDADEGGLSGFVTVPDDQVTGLEPGQDWMWREDRIQEILAADDVPTIFLSGCSSNQGTFYPQLDHIILLSAPTDLIVERLQTRTNNPYGNRPEDVARTLILIDEIEPLLRRGASHEIVTSISLDDVVAEVLRVVGEG